MIKEIDQSKGAFPTVIDCLTGCSVRQSMFKKTKRQTLAEATFSARTECSMGPHHIPQFRSSY